MVTSVFDLFKIGVGPSSSHTMGPMTAACRFVETLAEKALLDRVERVEVDLYGSLALTGKGHATDRAVLLGLSGKRPDTIDPDEADYARRPDPRDRPAVARRAAGDRVRRSRATCSFSSASGFRTIPTECASPLSPADGEPLESQVSYSVGGGAVVDEAAIARNAPPEGAWDMPYNYHSADQLLAIAEREGLTIADIARANERAGYSDEEIDRKLGTIVAAMSGCIDRGMKADGILPGGLKVKRRAPALHRLLIERAERTLSDPLTVLDWVNLWALAVNEENAAGGRVVTAPTNGAAGIVPAILALLSALHAQCVGRGRQDLPSHRRGDRLAVQGECLHLRSRGRLPGRGRSRLLDGGGRAHRGARRNALADRECRRDRHGA